MMFTCYFCIRHKLVNVNVASSNVLVVGSLLSNQNAGMSETQQGYLFYTNAVIPHKTSQQAHATHFTSVTLV